MIGAVAGDIVGSIYEFRGIKTKDFPLFGENCTFTDDTVMTCAVADAIMNGGQKRDFVRSMKKYGRMYPHAGYGRIFSDWLLEESGEPYGSFGNGSAMRVSPCAWLSDCETAARTGGIPGEVRLLARRSAEVTHNHPAGVRGALAVADAVFLARFYFGGWHFAGEEGAAQPPDTTGPSEWKRRIKEHIEREYGYDLSRTLDEIRPGYSFDATCRNSVPEAVTAFLESTDFEDAVRNAVSLGGDADTLAAIAGSIAEAAYGVPEEIRERAWSYLDEPLREVLGRWERFLEQRG